jgi:hypothetical protein
MLDQGGFDQSVNRVLIGRARAGRVQREEKTQRQGACTHLSSRERT